MAKNETLTAETISKEWLEKLMEGGHIEKITPEFIERMTELMSSMPIDGSVTQLLSQAEYLNERLLKTQTQLMTLAVMQANAMNVIEAFVKQGKLDKSEVERVYAELLPKTKRELSSQMREEAPMTPYTQ